MAFKMKMIQKERKNKKMTQDNMQLIMENWRSYTHQYILSDSDFNVLLENVNSGKIPRERAIKLWENSTSARLEQLLIQEGLGEDLMSAYEYIKGGVFKLKEKISDAALAAFEKVNDFLLKISVQAYQMATRSVEALVSAARALSNAVDQFKENHPLIYKIVKILVFCIIVFGIIQLFSGNAEAKVRLTTGKIMSEKEYRAALGALDDYGRSIDPNVLPDFEKITRAGEAQRLLQIAYDSNRVDSIKELGGLVHKSVQAVDKVVREAHKGSAGHLKLLERWLEIGKTIQKQI